MPRSETSPANGIPFHLVAVWIPGPIGAGQGEKRVGLHAPPASRSPKGRQGYSAS